MKDLLLYIAQNLVEHPEQVSVTEVENGDERTAGTYRQGDPHRHPRLRPAYRCQGVCGYC